MSSFVDDLRPGGARNLALDLRSAKLAKVKLSHDAATHSLATCGVELVLE